MDENNSVVTDFWATLTQNQKDDILLGIKEIENGEIVDFDEFIKK